MNMNVIDPALIAAALEAPRLPIPPTALRAVSGGRPAGSARSRETTPTHYNPYQQPSYSSSLAPTPPQPPQPVLSNTEVLQKLYQDPQIQQLQNASTDDEDDEMNELAEEDLATIIHNK